VTGSLALGLYAAALTLAIGRFLADWSAPLIQRPFQLPGISIPHLQSAGHMLLAVPFAWLMNRVPALKRLHVDPDATRRRLGLLGEPLALGFIIGFLLALFAGQSFVDVLLTAVNIAAVMVLIPRMVAIRVEALSPVAEAARDFMSKRFAGRPFYIGLDSAVLAGHPSVI